MINTKSQEFDDNLRKTCPEIDVSLYLTHTSETE